MSASSLSNDEVVPLLKAALGARQASYSPYSKFRVGAAALTEDGYTYLGCNVENASYGAGICAERTALVKAVSEGVTKFRAIAVSSDVPSPTTSPCGICRQFIREFTPDPSLLPIYLIGSNVTPAALDSLNKIAGGVEELVKDETRVVMRSLEELLPLSFGPDHLRSEAQG